MHHETRSGAVGFRHVREVKFATGVPNHDKFNIKMKGEKLESVQGARGGCKDLREKSGGDDSSVQLDEPDGLVVVVSLVVV